MKPMIEERMPDRELLCMIDMKRERLNDIYAEQKVLQQEITSLVEIMMKRGLENT